jgi:tubulin beta
VVCDEHSIGGDCEFYAFNDAQFDRINEFYYEAPGGKYVPRAVLFDLEPDIIDAARGLPLGELLRPENASTKTRARAITGPRAAAIRAGHEFC